MIVISGGVKKDHEFKVSQGYIIIRLTQKATTRCFYYPITIKK